MNGLWYPDELRIEAERGFCRAGWNGIVLVFGWKYKDQSKHRPWDKSELCGVLDRPNVGEAKAAGDSQIVHKTGEHCRVRLDRRQSLRV